MVYLKHKRIRNPIIYDDRYQEQGWVPFSRAWNMTSMSGDGPKPHTLDLDAYEQIKFATPHFSDKSVREDIYYKIPFSEFVFTRKAY